MNIYRKSKSELYSFSTTDTTLFSDDNSLRFRKNLSDSP